MMLPTAHLNLSAPQLACPWAASGKAGQRRTGRGSAPGGVPHNPVPGGRSVPHNSKAEPREGRRSGGEAPRRARSPSRARPPPSAPWPEPAAPVRDGAQGTLRAPPAPSAPRAAASPPPQPVPRHPGSGSSAEAGGAEGNVPLPVGGAKGSGGTRPRHPATGQVSLLPLSLRCGKGVLGWGGEALCVRLCFQ